MGLMGFAFWRKTTPEEREEKRRRRLFKKRKGKTFAEAEREVEASVRSAREASASGRSRDGEWSSRSGGKFNYGSSSHGGHGRERMYDPDGAQTFGRQHGSEDALTLLTGAEAREIPVVAFSVHTGNKSESYVRGPDGEFLEAKGDGSFHRGLSSIATSPRTVVTVHSAEVEGDSACIGTAGQRRRGSFNSLLLLEAQQLSVGNLDGNEEEPMDCSN